MRLITHLAGLAGVLIVGLVIGLTIAGGTADAAQEEPCATQLGRLLDTIDATWSTASEEVTQTQQAAAHVTDCLDQRSGS